MSGVVTKVDFWPYVLFGFPYLASQVLLSRLIIIRRIVDAWVRYLIQDRRVYVFSYGAKIAASIYCLIAAPMPPSSYSYLCQLKSRLNFRTHVPKTNHKFFQNISRTEWSLVQKMWFLQDSSPAFKGGGGPNCHDENILPFRSNVVFLRVSFTGKCISPLYCNVGCVTPILSSGIRSRPINIKYIGCDVRLYQLKCRFLCLNSKSADEGST